MIGWVILPPLTNVQLGRGATPETRRFKLEPPPLPAQQNAGDLEVGRENSPLLPESQSAPATFIKRVHATWHTRQHTPKLAVLISINQTCVQIHWFSVW